VVISHFNHVLQQGILLASLLPVLSAVAGNVVAYSATCARHCWKTKPV
jgi:Mg/Co/Ni transporter MgtE